MLGLMMRGLLILVMFGPRYATEGRDKVSDLRGFLFGGYLAGLQIIEEIGA
jgi:hypothetical protein